MVKPKDKAMKLRNRLVSNPRAVAISAALLAVFVGSLRPQIALSQAAPPSVYTTITLSLSTEHSSTAINARGDVAGNYGETSGHGYVVQDEVGTAIDYPGALETAVFGLNSTGEIVGYYLA